MDIGRLQDWLGLTPSDWPPPPRELLGLPPTAPREAAQPAALTRMALLRPHQLASPELVTEGMNRLAQAVILIESAPPPAPDRAFSLAPDEAPQVESRSAPAARVRARVKRSKPVEPLAQVPPQTPPPTPEARQELGPELLTLVAELPPLPPGLGREGRRAFYRELAALRSLLRALDAVQSTVADPVEPVTSPLAVTRFAEAASAMRIALGRATKHADATANCPNLSAICRAAHPAGVLRTLTPDQRGRVAREWAATRAWALGRQESLRVALRDRPRIAIIAPRLRFSTRPLEWIVAAIVALSALVALARYAGV